MRTILTGGGLLLASFAAALAANGAEPVKDEAQTRADRVQYLFDGMRAGIIAGELNPALLDWKDIPALLQHADSTVPMKEAGVRRGPGGNNRPLTEGMMALFLIERIRQGKEAFLLKPACYKEPEDEKNSPARGEPTEKELTLLYRAWWARVKNLDPKLGAEVDPLKDTKIHWWAYGC